MKPAPQTTPWVRPIKSVWRRSAGAGLLSISRGLSRIGRLGGTGLRILGYHGVCDDKYAGLPWVPDYFVTASSFEWQMEHVARNFRIVHILDVLDALQKNPDSLDGCVAITFDDVAACTVRCAVRVLDRFAIKASFFVSTGHVATGRMFDADVVRLLRWKPQLAGPGVSSDLRNLIGARDSFKNKTADELRRLLDGPQRRVLTNVRGPVYDALRPMNWTQVRQLSGQGHEIGAHTVDHAILGRLPSPFRRTQIVESIRELEANVGKAPIGFAYPNGGPGDFDESDAATLRHAGIRYALSTRAGVCESNLEFYNLPRTCIGMGHTQTSFALEMTGILDRRRRRQQGWT